VVKNNFNNVIYCIGDSHVSFFSGYNKVLGVWLTSHQERVPVFKSFNIGPRLAFNISKKNSLGYETVFKILESIPEGSYVMLCFGEIDCRVHLFKQAVIQKKNLKKVVNECVDRYFSLIKELKKMGYQVLVWHVIPSTVFEMKYIEFPTFGNCKQRNDVTKLFNKRLTFWAKKEKIPVISLFDKLVYTNGLTNMKYFIDPIHLSSLALPLVIEQIEKKVPRFNKRLLKQTFKLNKLEFIFRYYIRKPLYFNFIRFKIKTGFPYPKREKWEY